MACPETSEDDSQATSGEYISQNEGALLLREYVGQALHARVAGQNLETYRELIRHLQQLRKTCSSAAGEGTEAERDLEALLDGIGGCAGKLNERVHDDLLRELLSILPWGAPARVRKALMALIANLVVTRAAWVLPCIKLLVANLVPPPAPGAPQPPVGPWTPDARAVEVQADILATLQRVMGLVPTCLPQVRQMLLQHRPHKVRDKDAHCLYMRATYLLAEDASGAALRDGLLAGAVEHVLDIDVEIKWEDIMDALTGEEAEEGSSDDDEPAADDIFGMDGVGDLDLSGHHHEHRGGAAVSRGPADRGGWEGLVQGAVARHCGLPDSAEAAERRSAIATADKLDSMLELTFAHCAARRAAGQGRAMEATLLDAFEASILPTYRCKFAPYLVFAAAAASPTAFAPRFVSALVARIKDPSAPSERRAAAAAYLGSFMARAAFLADDVVVRTLQDLCTWACAYVRNCDARGSTTDLTGRHTTAPDAADAAWRRHEVLFAAAQSALYALCYRLSPIARAGGPPAAALADLLRGPVAELLGHRLAPLRGCLPSVAAEFHRQTANLGLLDCAALLPASATAQEGDAARAGRRLEMFFPFDPYLLRRSAAFLDLPNAYIVWRHGHPEAAAHPYDDSDAESNSDADLASDDDDESTSDSGTDAHHSQPHRMASPDDVSPSPASLAAAGSSPFGLTAHRHVTGASAWGRPIAPLAGGRGGARNHGGGSPLAAAITGSYAAMATSYASASPGGTSPPGLSMHHHHGGWPAARGVGSPAFGHGGDSPSAMACTPDLHGLSHLHRGVR